MDRRLADALHSGSLPFSGTTVRQMRPLSSSELLHLCRSTAGWIRTREPMALRILQDWTFHDGMVFDSDPLTLDGLDALFENESTLVGRLSTDTKVSIGVYPEDMSFFWRWGRRSELDEPFAGTFDVTAATDLIAEIPPELAEDLVRDDTFWDVWVE